MPAPAYACRPRPIRLLRAIARNLKGQSAKGIFKRGREEERCTVVSYHETRRERERLRRTERGKGEGRREGFG